MNGQAWATAGHFLVINRRYEEGIAAYRKAIALDPKLDDARAELGVNLMRLGHDDEARQQLTECYEHGWRNAETVNSLRLLDSYKNFVTFRTGNTILRLHTKEAALLRPYFEAEMQRAMATYERKYQMKLPGPVQVEVYPDHEDFAVRTMGLPGLGALGVTFGTVIAMDSPSGRTPGEFHWGATLWHEMSHVYVLTATHHLVPRWYTEGLAVHEETAASGFPDWGDPLEPEAIEAIRAKKLLPVADLDRGFVRPEYPGQVQVSYYQAGRICDFISEKWGEPMLLTMVHSFAERTTTDQVIRKDLGISPEEFDKQFMGWLDASTHTTVAHFDEWKQQMRALHEPAQAKNDPDQIRRARAIRDLYPQFVQPGNPYVLLAVAYLATGDKGSARRELESYVARGGRNPSEIKQLASLQVDAGEPKQAGGHAGAPALHLSRGRRASPKTGRPAAGSE